MPDFTLGTMRAAIDDSAWPAGADDADKTNLINKVREIFYYTPQLENSGVIWKGTEIALALMIYTNPDKSNVITLPRGVETIVGVYDSCETRIIQNQWFSYLRSFPSNCNNGWAITDLGDGWCGVVNLPTAGAQMKVTTTANEAGSLTIRFTGTDVNGRILTELLSIPTVAGNSVTSTNTFYSVSQVIVSVTAGYLEVYTTVLAVDTFYAQYQPGETIPNYRRYSFPTNNPAQAVKAICKRRYELLAADNDPCEVSSVLAFESGLAGYHWFQNHDYAAYRDAVTEAINYLNAELARFQSDTATGSVRMQRQVSAGSIRNTY